MKWDVPLLPKSIPILQPIEIALALWKGALVSILQFLGHCCPLRTPAALPLPILIFLFSQDLSSLNKAIPYHPTWKGLSCALNFHSSLLFYHLSLPKVTTAYV